VLLLTVVGDACSLRGCFSAGSAGREAVVKRAGASLRWRSHLRHAGLGWSRPVPELETAAVSRCWPGVRADW